jgi:hypothetical protein
MEAKSQQDAAMAEAAKLQAGGTKSVLILLYMCPHTAIYVSSYCYICVLAAMAEAAKLQAGGGKSVLILLYMCPHTAI